MALLLYIDCASFLLSVHPSVSIHSTAIVDEGATIGPESRIWHWGGYDLRSAVSSRDQYRNTWVGQCATLGANCTIVCGTRVGHHAFIGAGAVVNRDVKPFALMVGVPARQVGWMSAFGEQVESPSGRRIVDMS